MNRIYIVLCLFVLLPACSSTSLDMLREAELPDDPYYATLATQYRTYSESRAAQSDWEAARIFSEKGLAAAYAKPLPPEDPASWSLPEPSRKEFGEVRARLMRMLESDARTAFPKAAANALFFYDCWVEQRAGNWDAPSPLLCEQGYKEAMEAIHRKPVETMESKDIPADVPLSTSYLLFFGWDQADITKEAGDVLQKVVAYVGKLKRDGYEVVINGHTDRSGEEMYNLSLSNRRADVVKEALIKAGIQNKTISTFGFGESDPRVPTADGVRERANRRVEIFIE